MRPVVSRYKALATPLATRACDSSKSSLAEALHIYFDYFTLSVEAKRTLIRIQKSKEEYGTDKYRPPEKLFGPCYAGDCLKLVL